MKFPDSEYYYYNKDGLLVFTEKYHLKRGYCCNNKCLHCPYKNDSARPESLIKVFSRSGKKLR
ncbi:MAG: hypothetical protein IPH78_06680 [Bacteroidetes bacterium]|nr:hypothetical protein [Bacteroidota bacterium]MBK8658179.1 hypothetical protein [Bacteroidota bacterium]